MTDEEIQKLISQNNKLCMILGFASAMMSDLEAYISKEHYEWFNKAIENAIYLDEPLPKITK